MTTEQPHPGTTGGYDPALGYTPQIGPEEPATVSSEVPATGEPASTSRSRKRAWLAGAALVGVGLAAGSGITAAIVVPGSADAGSTGMSARQGGPGGFGGQGQGGQGQRGGPPDAGTGQQPGGTQSTAPTDGSSALGG